LAGLNLEAVVDEPGLAVSLACKWKPVKHSKLLQKKSSEFRPTYCARFSNYVFIAITFIVPGSVFRILHRVRYHHKIYQQGNRNVLLSVTHKLTI
jgi:hypothetical protein